MTRRLAVAVVCVAGLCLGVATLRGEDAKPAGASIAKSADLRTALIGTWKMASMKIKGEKNALPDESVIYKHVTPGGFTWLSYEKDSGKIFRAAGGTWTLKGDAYTETIQ